MDIKLFDTDNNDIIIPENREFEDNRELMSYGTEEAIGGEYVQEVLIKNEEGFNYPNFVIDLGEMTEMTSNQMAALSSLLTYRLEESDSYVYLATQKGTFQLGMAKKEKIDALIAILVNRTLGEEVKVYRDVDQTGSGELVRLNDITKVRLNL